MDTTRLLWGGKYNARDLLALKQSLGQLPIVRDGLAHLQAGRFRRLHGQLDELQDVRGLLEKSRSRPESVSAAA